MSDPGDCPRDAVNHDVVSTSGAKLAAEDEEVIPIFSEILVVTN